LIRGNLIPFSPQRKNLRPSPHTPNQTSPHQLRPPPLGNPFFYELFIFLHSLSSDLSKIGQDGLYILPICLPFSQKREYDSGLKGCLKRISGFMTGGNRLMGSNVVQKQNLLVFFAEG
jgi:hypothetical protein